VDVRAGYINHNGASPADNVTPNLPEGKRAEFTAGVGFNVGKGLRLDGAYMYIGQADRRGRTLSVDQFPAGVPKTNGLFTFHAHLFSASVSYVF
jgi:long-subunit fatty acid transport protein